MYYCFLVPKEIKSSRTSGGRSEISIEATLHEKTCYKGRVQGYHAESSTQGTELKRDYLKFMFTN